MKITLDATISGPYALQKFQEVATSGNNKNTKDVSETAIFSRPTKNVFLLFFHAIAASRLSDDVAAIL